MALVDLKNVWYTYPNGVKAVEDVTLSIEAGESVAIIGQNGAGKSTTVKMMNGLLKPASGELSVDGIQTVSKTTAQIARTVGYVFQNPDDQIFNNTVRKEIEYGLKRMKLDHVEITRRVEMAAELTGMTQSLDENPYDLPLSIRKFVTIASVIASDCKVMIFDEPTAGQDLAGLKRIANIINVLRSQGKALVTITHDMEFVAEHFTRIIVMANRRIVAEGSASDIFYDLESMDQARLNPPAIAELASKLGLPDVGLDIDKLAASLRMSPFTTAPA